MRASIERGVGVALLALASSAPARGAEPSTAEVLFREGRELLARGDTAAACPKLEESQRLDPAPGTEFNLARCYELLGRFASAWGAYSDVAELTHSLGQRERELRAREQVAAIEPRLSFVIVRAAAPPSGLLLTRDGVDMSLAELEVAIPVDQGDHVLAARAPGRLPWGAHFRVSREGERVTVEVPPLELAPPEPSVSPVADTAPGRTDGARIDAADRRDASLVASTPTASRGSTQRTIAVALLGTSLVAAGCGAYFGIEAIQLGNQSRASQSHAAWEQSNLNGNLATATFIGSGVLLLAGGVSWFTAPRTPKPPAAARLALTWTATSKGAGAFLTGSW